MNLEEAAVLATLTIECPHPSGSAEAAHWWREEWAAAIERGDVEPRAEDTVPQKLPGFPVDALPEPMRSTVETVAANKRVPVEMPALLALTCVAVFAAPRLTIYRGRDWWEPLAEWTLTIADSGEGKSPAVSVFADIIRDVQRWINAQHAARVADQVTEVEELIAAKTRAREGMTKAEQDQRAGEVKELNDQIERLNESKPAQLLIGGSTTLEAIERAMASNGGAIAVIDDEGGAFGIVSGVYNNGVPTGLDTILKGYSGTWVPANERITRATESIPRAILSYGITVQPTVLAESFRSPALRARGFHARWCYATPEPLVGSRSVDPPDLDYPAVHEFTEALKRIAELPPIDAENDARRSWPALELTREARKLHMELQEAFEPRLNGDTGDLGFMLDWANKFPGRVLRHAGLLHLAAGFQLEDPVSEETMRSAITIGEWALEHAADVYRRAPRPKVKGRDADGAGSMVGTFRILRWISKTKTVAFSTRDAFMGVRKQAWCSGVDDVQEVLVALHRDGLLRTVPRYGSDGRALPAAPWWVSHPDVVYGA